MTSPTFSFDLHGIVSLRIEGGSSRGPLQSLSYPYSFFSSETVSDPDITVQLGPFEPDLKSGRLVDHKYLVDSGQLVVHDHSKGARWKVEISGLESDKLMVKFQGISRSGILRLVPEFLAHNVVICPLVELVLNGRGATVLHGAGVERGGDAIVLAGRGGVHKTSLAMDLVRRHGFSYLGDDRIILLGGDVLAYPYLVDLFEFRMRHLKTEHMTPARRLAFGLYLAGLWGKRDVSWRVSKNANLRVLAEVTRTNVGAVEQESLDVDTAVQKAVTSAKLELQGGDPRQLGVRSSHFSDYLKAYLYENPDSRLGNLWSEVSEALHDTLTRTKVVSIKVPIDYEASQAGDLISALA